MMRVRFAPVMGLVGLLVWIAGCAALPGAHADDALDVLQARIIRVSEAVTPAVVHVEAVVRQNNRRNIVTGSGFMIKSEGIALTNHHVVERAEKVTVPSRVGRAATRPRSSAPTSRPT